MKNAIVHSLSGAVSELQKMYPPAPAEPFVRIVLALLIGTVLLGLLFYLLERLFPEQPEQRTKGVQPARYGLGEEQAPASLWGQLRWPFRG